MFGAVLAEGAPNLFGVQAGFARRKEVSAKPTE
jgi:hypothetical protein